MADGSWIVIEAGDGQVSGLSDHQDRVAFMAILNEAMKG
nr:ATP-grasp domain-containing protein [Enterococcus cecorum]